MSLAFAIEEINNQTIAKIIDILKKGGVGVLPTDTIYGLHALALNKRAVQKISDLKQRAGSKPFIVIISSLDQLKLLNIQITKKQKDLLLKIWPNPISVALQVFDPEGSDRRGVALRMPKYDLLQKILTQTGPLISTSANISDLPPAENIEQAKKYFEDRVDFYVDAGVLKSDPSTLVEIKDDQVKILRQGRLDVSKLIQLHAKPI